MLNKKTILLVKDMSDQEIYFDINTKHNPTNWSNRTPETDLDSKKNVVTY
jgi:hypothetical protein